MPDTQTPLERAAEAARFALWNDDESDAYMHDNDSPDHVLIDGNVNLLVAVRAAFMALREPTPFMVQAAYEKAGGCSAENLPPAETWQAMIDAMLAENAR